MNVAAEHARLHSLIVWEVPSLARQSPISSAASESADLLSVSPAPPASPPRARGKAAQQGSGTAALPALRMEAMSAQLSGGACGGSILRSYLLV